MDEGHKKGDPPVNFIFLQEGNGNELKNFISKHKGLLFYI
jgi:hypothetical protein